MKKINWGIIGLGSVTTNFKDEDKILNIDSVENIYEYKIGNISKNILESKTKIDFPGLTINNTIGNMKIIDKWLN